VRLARSSSAAALPGQAAQGYPLIGGRDFWGGLLWVTFLGRARKVTSRRAAPGLLCYPLVMRRAMLSQLFRNILGAKVTGKNSIDPDSI